MHCREVQRGTDVVEAARRAVLGQKVAQGRVDAEEVMHRLDILRAVEPPVNDAALALLLAAA